MKRRKTRKVRRKPSRGKFVFVTVYNGFVKWQTTNNRNGSDPFSNSSDLKRVLSQLKSRLGLQRHQMQIRDERTKRGLRRNAPRLNMYTPGEKYIGTFEIAKPDGDYDVWEVVRRGRVFVIGTATNSGLLSDYYFKMEQGESEQKALEEINADLEVLATDGPSYMSRVTKIPARKAEVSEQRAERRRNLRGNPNRQKAPRYSKTLPNKFYKIYWSHHSRGDTAGLVFKGDKIIKISMSELSRFWPMNEGLKMERLHVLGPFDSWDQAFASQK